MTDPTCPFCTPDPDRIFYVKLALDQGWPHDEIYRMTGIDPWFLDQIQQIVLHFGLLAPVVQHSRHVGRPAKASIQVDQRQQSGVVSHESDGGTRGPSRQALVARTANDATFGPAEVLEPAAKAQQPPLRGTDPARRHEPADGGLAHFLPCRNDPALVLLVVVVSHPVFLKRLCGGGAR